MLNAPLPPTVRFLQVGRYVFGDDLARLVYSRLPAEGAKIRNARAHVTAGKGGKITRVTLPPDVCDRVCAHEFGHAAHLVLWPRESETYRTYRLEMAAVWAEARFYTLWNEEHPDALEWWMKTIFEPFYLSGSGVYRAAGRRLQDAWDAGEWDPGFFNPQLTFGNVFHERRGDKANGPRPTHPPLHAD